MKSRDEEKVQEENNYDEKTLWEEWKEMDDARRYREWESDQRRPY